MKGLAEDVGALPRVQRSPDPTDDFLLALSEAGPADYLGTGCTSSGAGGHSAGIRDGGVAGGRNGLTCVKSATVSMSARRRGGAAGVDLAGRIGAVSRTPSRSSGPTTSASASAMRMPINRRITALFAGTESSARLRRTHRTNPYVAAQPGNRRWQTTGIPRSRLDPWGSALSRVLLSRNRRQDRRANAEIEWGCGSPGASGRRRFPGRGGRRERNSRLRCRPSTVLVHQGLPLRDSDAPFSG